jgi:hypothetical protein
MQDEIGSRYKLNYKKFLRTVASLSYMGYFAEDVFVGEAKFNARALRRNLGFNGAVLSEMAYETELFVQKQYRDDIFFIEEEEDSKEIISGRPLRDYIAPEVSIHIINRGFYGRLEVFVESALRAGIILAPSFYIDRKSTTYKKNRLHRFGCAFDFAFKGKKARRDRACLSGFHPR